MLNSFAAILDSGGAGGAYESIATATGTGSSGTITFSSIPSTYKHLQIRYSILPTTAAGSLFLRVNGLSTSIYTEHLLYGNGTSAVASARTAQSRIYLESTTITKTTTAPSVGIIDLQNYASTTQNKTVRNFYGMDTNGTGEINVSSGLIVDTQAIGSLIVGLTSTSFSTSSTVSLYGIKGA